MTPEEQSIVAQKLSEVAEILYNNTPSEELATFETIELSVREYLLGIVAPKLGEFFSREQEEVKQEESAK
jgi:hypothetical protein